MPSKVLIVGGGTAGWMSALFFAQIWGKKGSEISLVESSEISTIGVGEGSTPNMRDYFQWLEIPEKEWMPYCYATYKVGINFSNWLNEEKDKSFFHPFTSGLDKKFSEQFYKTCDLKRQGHHFNIYPEDFFFNTKLAKESKSPIPLKELPFSSNYAYHFDASRLAEFLKKKSIERGINHIVDTVIKAEQNEQGHITQVHTKENGILSADFFIDCSGFSSLLIEKTLKNPFKSYEESLFNDRAVAISTPIKDHINIPSHTQAKAMKNGWAWTIPLTNRFGHGYVYSSKYISPEQAEDELRNLLGPDTKDDYKAKHLKMRIGRMEKHWSHNCLAVGLSQGFIEPLEATALMLVFTTLKHFFLNFSNDSQEIFNKLINWQFDEVHDFIVLHFLLNKRSDAQYWIDNRENKNISQRLLSYINTWDHSENFKEVLEKRPEIKPFLDYSWYCIFAGMKRSNIDIEKDCKPKDSNFDEMVKTHQSLIESFYDQRNSLDLLKK